MTDEPLYTEAIKELLDSVTKKEYGRTALHPRKGIKEHNLDCLNWEHKNSEGYWLPLPAPPLKGKQFNTLWGYKLSECKNFLVPIPEQLDKLQEAKEYVKQHSYDTVARWLTAVTGRKIGYNELYDRINNGRARQKRAAKLRAWAICFRKSIEAAQQIEEAFTDAGELKNYTKEGVINLAKKADWQPLNSFERYTPAAFDDGTTPEARTPKKARSKHNSGGGPRRPNRTRAGYRGKVEHL